MAGRRSRGLIDKLLGKSDYEFDDEWLPDVRRKMKAKLGEDMSKRITEKSNAGEGVKVDKKPKTVKVIKKETSVETPTGNIGTASGEIGPDMGRVNREAPVLDLSTQYVPDEEKKSDDRSTWVDPHEQARRMMGFKKGGTVKKKSGGCGMKKGGVVKASGASRRGDGCAMRGKTRGRMV